MAEVHVHVITSDPISIQHHDSKVKITVVSVVRSIRLYQYRVYFITKKLLPWRKKDLVP